MNFSAFDPVTGQAIEPTFQSATQEQVDAAAVAAAAAFRDYSGLPGAARARLLRAIADGIEASGERLVECVQRETALPVARIRNERARTCMQLRLFAETAEEGTWVDERLDASDPERQLPKPQVRSLLRPLGPVVVFGASNFPLAFSVAGGDTAAALAVGCPVIVKAHPAHPATSAMIGEVIEEARNACALPAGVFSLLFDAGHEVGLALIQHPLIKAGAFTGSARGGLALLRAAQARPEPIPFFAEMGSVNPVFLLPQALERECDALASGLQASITLGCGQFCTQPGLVFIQEDAAAHALLEKLAQLLKATPAGVLLTPAVHKSYHEAVTQRAAVPGVETLAQVEASGDGYQAGAALFATDAATFLKHPCLAEEIFGPTTLVVRCKDLTDFERCAQRLPGQLTATVWTSAEELKSAAQLLWLLEQKAGRIVFNGFPTGVEVGAAMMHGGPFPATSDSRFTSVGTRALLRFVRPVAYQGEFT